MGPAAWGFITLYLTAKQPQSYTEFDTSNTQRALYSVMYLIVLLTIRALHAAKVLRIPNP